MTFDGTIYSLPQGSDGRYYITEAMLEDCSELADYLRRTRNSWWRDEERSRWVSYVMGGQ